MQQIKNFFAYATERHAIYLRRQMGIPKSELTEDPILQTYRFCNVFRELDTTTIWLRKHVRDPLRDKPEVLLATVLFRWFNRIQTGEAIFKQTYHVGSSVSNWTAWDQLLEIGEVSDIRHSVLAYCGKGPYVTGSYIIKTPDGKNKLDGVLWCVEQFMKLEKTIGRLDSDADANDLDWREVARVCLEHPGTVSLETVWDWLRQFPYLGDFMAYEIVTDLRHTVLLDRAPDIMTWANPGPGAMRGLNRIYGRDLDKKLQKHVYIREMQDLLKYASVSALWPQWNGQAYIFSDRVPGDMDAWQPEAWPEWDMRTVEHTLCEFDKYERVRLGQGAPRQKFR